MGRVCLRNRVVVKYGSCKMECANRWEEHEWTSGEVVGRELPD